MASSTAADDRHDEGPTAGVEWTLEETIVVASIGAVLIGSLLPWQGDTTGPWYAFDGYGLWTFVLGVVAAGVVYWHGWTPRTMMTMLVIGAMVGAMGIYALSGASIGVYVTLLGALGLYVGGMRGYEPTSE